MTEMPLKKSKLKDQVRDKVNKKPKKQIELMSI